VLLLLLLLCCRVLVRVCVDVRVYCVRILLVDSVSEKPRDEFCCCVRRVATFHLRRFVLRVEVLCWDNNIRVCV